MHTCIKNIHLRLESIKRKQIINYTSKKDSNFASFQKTLSKCHLILPCKEFVSL
jgi:hypothetical protein